MVSYTGIGIGGTATGIAAKHIQTQTLSVSNRPGRAVAIGGAAMFALPSKV